MRDIEVFLITNRNLVESDEEYFAKIKNAIEAGVKNIIFREKDLSYEKQRFYYKEILELASEFQCKVIINSNVKLYKNEEGFALHLSFNDFKKYEKEYGEIIGVSVHSVEEAIAADKLGANYILASNIYETKCKEGLKGKGIEFLRDIKSKVNCKVVALGGINENNVEEIYKVDVKSIGIMSLIMTSNYAKDVMKKIIGN